MADSSARAPSPEHAVTVAILSGRDAGRVIHLDKDSVTVGRHQVSDILLGDLAVGRRHATIYKAQSGDYVIRDEYSANGTFVNGVRLGECEQILSDGDVILVGQTELLFYRG